MKEASLYLGIFVLTIVVILLAYLLREIKFINEMQDRRIKDLENDIEFWKNFYINKHGK